MKDNAAQTIKELTLEANSDLIQTLMKSIHLYARSGDHSCIINKDIDIDKAVWCLENLGFYAKAEDGHIEVRW